jgi:FkbM family methyltransferase
VGSNIGFTTLKMAQLAPGGQVFGFEPDPYNYSRCLHNAKLNSLPNVKIFNEGLGNQRATMQMELRTASNRGGNRINSQAKDSYDVQINKLDNIVPHLNISKLDLIKVDVEGYELKVLQGAEESLRKFNPILFVELDDNNLRDQGDSAELLIRFLNNCGYKKIIHAESSEVITSYNDFNNCHFDIIVQ